MTVNAIQFRELPFRPDLNQVFYIENGYDVDANDFIRNRYFDLKSMFSHIGMEFCYLPYLLRAHDVEAKVRYYAPYLSPELLVTEVQSNAFVRYISDSETRQNLKPSFIFEGKPGECGGNAKFLQVLLSDIDFTKPESIEDLMRLVAESREAYYREIMCDEILDSKLASCIEIQDFEESASYDMQMSVSCPSAAHSSDEERKFRKPEDTSLEEQDDVTASAKTEDELAEEQSLIETAEVLRELRMTVQKLRLEGVSLMAIHEFIDKQEPLSRMVITPDYRIFLPDYNDMEIEMGALPKAIYFLYLRYPEGIIYKHMQDYYNELLNIYRQLRPNTDEARLNLTITKVVNPLGNALNENIARIRKAFVEKFDEHLANNYIITGERGSQYTIPLDRELITWEE